MVMKLVYRLAGAHYHCKLFVANHPGATYAKCGDLVFRVEEWNDVKRSFAENVLVYEEQDARMERT